MFYYLNTINLNIYYISFKINRNLLQRKCQALSPLSPNVHLHQSTNHPYVIWFDLQSRTTHKWTHHKLSLSGLTLVSCLIFCLISTCLINCYTYHYSWVCLLHFYLTILKTDKKTDGVDKGLTELQQLIDKRTNWDNLLN